MNQALRDAWAKRSDARLNAIREMFVRTVEVWLRSVIEIHPDLVKHTWKMAADLSALFAVQVGVTKEQILEWIGESFELYSAIIKESGQDPQAAKVVVMNNFE